MAVLKTLGFGAAQIFGLLLAEALALALGGALVGCSSAWAALHSLNLYQYSQGLFVNFDITPVILGRALAVAAALGWVSCFWPALACARRSVTEGLRAVD